MAKKNNNTLYIIGGIIIVVLLTIIIMTNFPKAQIKEELTENDFKILSASWNTEGTKYDEEKETYVPDETKPKVDWEYYCNGCEENPNWEWCKLSNWHYTTQQSEDLSCQHYYDGLLDSGLPEGHSYFLEKGIKYFGLGSSLSITENHEFMICCESNYKEGKVCSSITLPAKC